MCYRCDRKQGTWGGGLINTEGDELRVKGTTNQGEETNADQRETDSNTQRTEYKNKQRNWNEWSFMASA